MKKFSNSQSYLEVLKELRALPLKSLKTHREIIVQRLTISKLNGDERNEVRAWKVFLMLVDKVLNEKV